MMINNKGSVSKTLLVSRCMFNNGDTQRTDSIPIVEALSAYDRLTTAVLGAVQGHPIS